MVFEGGIVIIGSRGVDYCSGIRSIRSALLPVHTNVIIHQKVFVHVHLDYVVEGYGPDAKIMLFVTFEALYPFVCITSNLSSDCSISLTLTADAMLALPPVKFFEIR